MATENQLNSVLVLRNGQTSEWESSDKVLKKGELGLEYTEDGTVKIKAGNDSDKFADLAYVGSDVKPAQVFQVTLDENDTDDIAAIEAKLAELAEANDGEAIELSIGDIAIVKNDFVSTDTTIASSLTSYVWDGANWVATEGNYSANNVYLPEDIVTAGPWTRTANLTKSSNTATGTFATKGLSVMAAFKKMLTGEALQPTKSEPAVTTKINGSADNISKEVGETFTPSYSASLSAGSYTYGPATGITAKSWVVTDSEGAEKTTSSGSFDSFTIEDDTSYSITATATYDAGTVAKDNLGSPSSPTVQIAAGSKSDTSGTVTGYRKWFYGYKNGDNTVDCAALTSAIIRGLTGGTSFPSQLTTNKMQQIIFAAPATANKTTIEVKDATNGAPQTVTGPITVQVEGANGYKAVDYDVWYVSNASAAGGELKFNITVK